MIKWKQRNDLISLPRKIQHRNPAIEWDYQKKVTEKKVENDRMRLERHIGRMF